MSENETVSNLLARQSRQIPEKKALVCGDRDITYGELKYRADRFAAGLAGLGISRGDTFALCLSNSTELVTAFYALAGLGAVTVWINPAYVGEQFEFILSDSKARGDSFGFGRGEFFPSCLRAEDPASLSIPRFCDSIIPLPRLYGFSRIMHRNCTSEKPVAICPGE